MTTSLQETPTDDSQREALWIDGNFQSLTTAAECPCCSPGRERRAFQDVARTQERLPSRLGIGSVPRTSSKPAVGRTHRRELRRLSQWSRPGGRRYHGRLQRTLEDPDSADPDSRPRAARRAAAWQRGAWPSG